MRGAFVVQLGSEPTPADGRLEGWVQEVDSFTELRFRSGEELLNFIAKRFELAVAPSERLQERNRNEQIPSRKKAPASKET